MKTHHTIVHALIFGIVATQSVWAGGKTNACTPPEGKIDIQPSQKCGGKYTVAIGKDLTLKAVSLKDKDCYCGRGVQDTINTDTGVRWSVGGGIGYLDGGADGTPKTYTAPDTVHTNLAVRLQVDDEATAPETYDDGGFKEVSNLNLDVVIPDTISIIKETPLPTICTAQGKVGNVKALKDRVSKAGCSVDFSGLQYSEDTVVSDEVTLCGFGHGIIGGAITAIDANNENTGSDVMGFCEAASFSSPANCESSWKIWWRVAANHSVGAGSWRNVKKRTYKFTNPTSSPTNPTGLVLHASF